MKRSEAARLIEKIREITAEYGKEDRTSTLTADSARDMLRYLEEALLYAGVEPLQECHGEAHSSIFIDNCMVCAPRWGWKGEKVKVT